MTVIWWARPVFITMPHLLTNRTNIMLKSRFLLTVLASSLVACGGGSSSSKKEPSVEYKAPAPIIDSAVNQLPLGYIDYSVLANSECGSNQDVFTDTTVSADFSTYRGYPLSNDGWLRVSGTNNRVCIDGSVGEVTLEGGGTKLYVAGDLTKLTVKNVTNTVYVYGNVDQLSIENGMHDVHVIGRIGYLQFDTQAMFNKVYYTEIGSYDNDSVSPEDNELIDMSVLL